MSTVNKPSTRRGSATFQKVIEAGVQCIANNGFHSASTNKIAKAAGVTWGTLQHQFGDKARLLEAILEHCFTEQMEQLAQSASATQPLEQRVDAAIEAIWRNQQTPSSRVLQEILQGVQSDDTLRERFHPTLQQQRDFHNAQWQQIFHDVTLPPEQMEATKQLAFATLRGLAFDITIRSSDATIQQAKEMLKEIVLKTFSQ